MFQLSSSFLKKSGMAFATPFSSVSFLLFSMYLSVMPLSLLPVLHPHLSSPVHSFLLRHSPFPHQAALFWIPRLALVLQIHLLLRFFPVLPLALLQLLPVLHRFLPALPQLLPALPRLLLILPQFLPLGMPGLLSPFSHSPALLLLPRLPIR